jgi:hypothetical protein
MRGSLGITTFVPGGGSAPTSKGTACEFGPFILRGDNGGYMLGIGCSGGGCIAGRGQRLSKRSSRF